MLEKDKNCIEFSMHSMMATHKPYQEGTEIAITGMAPGKSLLFANNPFDIPCDVVVIPKRAFERLQADNQHYRELAKQWEKNYKALLDKTGFYNLADLLCYLPKDKTLKDIIDSRDTENEQLKKKLEEFSPIPGYREFLTALYPEEDVEKLVWATEQTCCGRDLRHALQVDLEYYRALSSAQAQSIYGWKEVTGFSSVDEIKDYLTNEAECDTLHEAILKLKDQVKYTCDEWYSANSSNNSWKAAAECNSPKELIEEREVRKKEIEVYSRTLQEWKEGTGCPSPSAAKTLIESRASWFHAYNEIKAANEKLADSIKAWQNVTGYATPEDYMHARINCVTPFDYTAAWRKATGCNLPDEAEKRIKALNERIDESEACYNHLLMFTGFGDEGEIEDALDKCDHSTLRKALVDYEFDYENLLKLTGYESEHDIRVALNDSEQFVYKNMKELIYSLKRKAKFTESNWQTATGCDTPGRAEEKLEYYKERLDKALTAANRAKNCLDTITL